MQIHCHGGREMKNLAETPDFVFFHGFPAIHGITTNSFGDCSFDDRDQERAQNDRLIKMVRVRGDYFKMKPQHRDEVAVISPHGITGNYPECDSLVYFHGNGRGFPYLLGPTADCPYVLLAHARHLCGASIHSGWRSTRLDIVGKTVKVLKQGRIDLREVMAVVWPGICWECYEVGEEFKEYFPMEYYGGRLDLRLKIWRQLVRAGIPAKNIILAGTGPDDMGLCSKHTVRGEQALFASNRRDGNGERNQVFLKL